jgi:hypothetical protein
MIKLLGFLGLSVLLWILVLLYIIMMVMKVGTQPYRVRTSVVMVSNSLVVSLGIFDIFYYVSDLYFMIIGVVFIWTFPILFGDMYYDNKDRKTSRKESEKSMKVLDSVLRSFNKKCKEANIESGIKIEDITK